MNKHIRIGFFLIISFIKFSIIKLFYYKSFKFSAFNNFSPFTQIELDQKSTLILNKRVRAKSGTKIKLRNKSIVEIGQDTSFNHGCMLISHEKVTIGNNVQFGPNVLIYDHDHDYRTENGLKNLQYKTAPVEIGNNVWIGANVVILKGTIIGDNCVVGAGSILKGTYTRDKLIIQEKKTVLRSINNGG